MPLFHASEKFTLADSKEVCSSFLMLFLFVAGSEMFCRDCILPEMQSVLTINS